MTQIRQVGLARRLWNQLLAGGEAAEVEGAAMCNVHVSGTFKCS